MSRDRETGFLEVAGGRGQATEGGGCMGVRLGVEMGGVRKEVGVEVHREGREAELLEMVEGRW